MPLAALGLPSPAWTAQGLKDKAWTPWTEILYDRLIINSFYASHSKLLLP